MVLILTDGRDLKGVERPEDIKYMKYLRFTLKAIGGWPGYMIGQPYGYLFHSRAFLTFICSTGLAAGIIYLYNHVGILSFFEIGQTYVTVFMTAVGQSRNILIWTQRYADNFKEFVTKVHLFNHRNRSPYFMKMHLYVHKISHFFTIYMIGVMIWGILLFNLIPLQTTITNGGFQRPPPENVTYELSVYFATPFEYQHHFKGYMIMFIYDWSVSYMCSSYFCIFDLYLALMMFHLWGHLKVLIYNLENFPKPATRNDANPTLETYECYTPEEIPGVTDRLNEIVEHHNLILSYTDDVSVTFGPAIAVTYAFHQISGCLLLLEVSQGDPKAIIRFGPLTLILLQLLVQMSVIFELIGSMTDQLINAAYYLPWQYMDKGNRIAAQMVMRQVQRPLGLKAVGMVDVGCQTMTTTTTYKGNRITAKIAMKQVQRPLGLKSVKMGDVGCLAKIITRILKTSFSYFIMLRTMATREE